MSVRWLFDVFEWSLRNFSPGVFYGQTRLVLPTNEHFPGKVDSVQGMAELVFERVAEYAGMAHWLWQVVEKSHCDLDAVQQIPSGATQEFVGSSSPSAFSTQALPVVYDRLHIGNPEALIAGFAHTLGQYLGYTAKEAPPGGVNNWPQITEVLADYLGFGLMFANSAFVFPSGGCSSCATTVRRNSALSQWDHTYALALFATLKGIPPRKVKPYLKKSLRGYYQRCLSDISGRPEFSLLKQYSVEPRKVHDESLIRAEN
ncbi:hypothetical protein [Thiolapillus brandeum]|uniref:hypothetical protein n=1 Tax=Thiolapillus brandeum TaxID=1076588 RepID=UPI001186849D|nr:hypothetical protein [Thiolapillus brandeum]